jgi:CRISPR-associated protein Csm3
MAQLIHYIRCTAQIEVLSGLHIGGSKEGLKTSGIDSPVIRNPVTMLPYIPGSSLKGRFRMALELKYNDFNDETSGGGPSQNNDNNSKVAIMFGNANTKKSQSPSRLIFRDAPLSEGFHEYSIGEEKKEVLIDRKKLTSFGNIGPRTLERIPAGAKFDFEVMIRVFKGDDEDLFTKRLKEAMNMVELEWLGSSGSRGSGQVKFHDFKCEKVEI